MCLWNSKSVMLPLFVASLAGCGSGGGGSLTYAETYALYSDAFALLETDTRGTDLPTTGQARYSGGINLFFRDDVGVNSGVQFAGALDMTADFAADSFTGSATNFVSTEDEAVEGTITIGAADSIISRPADFSAQVVADVIGTLTDADGLAYATTMTLTGSFTNGTDLFLGSMDGTYDTGDGPRPAEGQVAGTPMP